VSKHDIMFQEVKQTNNIYTIQYTKCALAYMILKNQVTAKVRGTKQTLWHVIMCIC